MEENRVLPNTYFDGSVPALGVETRPTWGCLRGLLLACGSLYFVVALFGAAKWSFLRHMALDDALLFPADNSAPRKLLAVVVPTHAGDIQEAVVALSRWPTVCSVITRHRMQLVVYYSGNVGDGAWSEDVIPTIAQTGGGCFERTRVIFADLDEEVNASHVGFLSEYVSSVEVRQHGMPAKASVL